MINLAVNFIFVFYRLFRFLFSKFLVLFFIFFYSAHSIAEIKTTENLSVDPFNLLENKDNDGNGNSSSTSENYDFETSEDDEGSIEDQKNINIIDRKIIDREEKNKNVISDDKFNLNRQEHKIAVIACLNKVTAKSREISIKIGKSEFCGNLEIKAIKCVSLGLRKNIFDPFWGSLLLALLLYYFF